MTVQAKAGRSNDQFALKLPARPSYIAGDFVVAACNRAAHQVISRWPNWPHFAVWLHGPPGAGKTHLAHIWATAAEAESINLGDLDPRDPSELLRSGRHWVVELDGTVTSDRLENALFHFHNLVQQSNGWMVLVACKPAARWPVALPDLRSRLAACQNIGIAAPDDELLGALLRKLAADRQLALGEPAATFLVRRIARTYGAIADIVDALDRASLAKHRAITRDLAREVWESQFTDADEPGGDQ